MTTYETRLQKLINALDEYNRNWCYIDEETDEWTCPDSEDEVYNEIMADEELHFLGTETVKSWIHIWRTNEDQFNNMCKIAKVASRM